ncbi:MAG: hypothetical protein AAGA80_05880 [Cyanobacteria bacterium P01_F01_bin.143]
MEENALTWLNDNKEWVFSGVGITLTLWILTIFRHKVFPYFLLLSNRYKSFLQEYKFDKIQVNLEKHQSTFFWGIHFQKTIQIYEYDLKKSLEKGRCLRFLLVKPNGSAIKMAAFRNESSVDKDRPNKSLKLAIRYLADIEELVKEDFKTRNISMNGQIKVRLIDSLPPYTIIAVNTGSDDGEMHVLLSPFRSATEGTPFFSLRKNDYWFQFFVDQFEAVWNDPQAEEVKDLKGLADSLSV